MVGKRNASRNHSLRRITYVNIFAKHPGEDKGICAVAILFPFGPEQANLWSKIDNLLIRFC
jgi:hypothetical protein